MDTDSSSLTPGDLLAAAATVQVHGYHESRDRIAAALRAEAHRLIDARPEEDQPEPTPPRKALP